MKIAIKSINFPCKLEEKSKFLLKQYTKSVNLFLDYIIKTKYTSLGKLNKQRPFVMAQTGITGYNSCLALKDALGMYRSWKKKKGKKSKPIMRNKIFKIQLGYTGKFLDDNTLRVTFQPKKYGLIYLKQSSYLKDILELEKKGEISFGAITVQENSIAIPIKKEYKPFSPKNILSVDINEKNISCLLLKDEKYKFFRFDEMGNIFNINTSTYIHTKLLQKNYPNRFTMWKKVTRRYYKNRNNKVKSSLHLLTNKIVDLAYKNKAVIVLEDLKNLTKGINKKVMKKNKVTGEIIPHRKIPRNIRGRLNRTSFNNFLYYVSYKCEWKNVPYIKINPRGTSSICPICGSKLRSSEWHIKICKQCDYQIDRDTVAVCNIADKYIKENEGVGFAPDWRTMIFTQV